MKQGPNAGPALLLNITQTAQLFGVAERTLHKIRHEDWFPKAIEIRPGLPRWHRVELEQALASKAPRQTVKREEPDQLRVARSARISA